jgi:hypothetical protein
LDELTNDIIKKINKGEREISIGYGMVNSERISEITTLGGESLIINGIQLSVSNLKNIFESNYKKIELTKCDINDTNIKYIVPNIHLKELSLINNGITDDGIHILMPLIQDLILLNVGLNNITNIGLADIFLNGKHLSVLGLSGLKLDDTSSDLIKSFINDNYNIKQIILSNNELTNITGQKLLDVINKSSLIILNLNMTNMTSKMKNDIFTNLKNNIIIKKAVKHKK